MSGKKFKMPSAFRILFFIIVIVAMLTWFIPSGQYQKDEEGHYIAGSYVQTEHKPQGIWDTFMAPVYGMLGRGNTSGAIEISLFILIIGGFLGVTDRTGAINSGISALVAYNRGKEKRLILLLMMFFALGGTTYGMAEETIVFYPLIIPVMLAAGFDTLAAVSIVLLGAGVGVLGSTVNPFATGVASQALGIGIADGILWRLIILFVSLAITVIYVYNYALTVKKSPEKSLIADKMDDDKKHFQIPDNLPALTGSQKAVLTLFMLTFAIMIISLVPWAAIIPGFTFFETSLQYLTDIPGLGVVIGKDAVPWGDWYFSEITMLFLIMAVFIGIVYKMQEQQIVEGFIQGAGSLLSVAFVVAVARGIQVIMNDAEITATILHWCEEGLKNMPKGLFGVCTYLMYIVMSFLIPSTSGLASATMAVVGPMADFAGVQKHVVVTAFQTASGIVNMITPTSGVIMGAMAISRLPFAKWLIFSGKLLGILLVVNGAVIWIAAAVG